MYSAFLIDGTIYFIRTGPGWQRLGGAYAAMNFVTNPVIERQINKNRQMLTLLNGWDYRRDVPQRAEISYPIDMLKTLLVIEPRGSAVATIRLKSRSGKPRCLSLDSQDYLGDPQVRRAFFAKIAITELR